MTKLQLTLALSVALTTCIGCGGADPGDGASSEDTQTSGDEGLPDTEPTGRATMSAEECEAGGGELVGDIGDGATHRADYVCPNGQPPLGDVPLGVEGSVCCPG